MVVIAITSLSFLILANDLGEFVVGQELGLPGATSAVRTSENSERILFQTSTTGFVKRLRKN